MAKYVYVDKKCIGCQTCIRTVPSLFFFNQEKRQAQCVIDEDTEFPLEDERKLQEALDACPLDAIMVVDK